MDLLKDDYCVPIYIINDDLVEEDEMFHVSLKPNHPAIQLGDRDAQITILDNDF